MEELLARIWENLGGRVDGPLSFRLIMQPAVATVLAIRAGIKDAKIGRPPYFWKILTNSNKRLALLREGWTAVATVFALALIIDVVYQVIVYRRIYPLESLIAAFLLACVPYLLVRGPANRIASVWRKP